MAIAAQPSLPRTKRAFVVRESKYQAGVKKRWRRPRGIHSPVRQRHKGKPALPHPGYGRAAVVRGLHRSGLKPVLVSSIKEMEQLDPKKEGALLSATLGAKKKMALLAHIEEKKITVLNIPDVNALQEKLKASFDARKKQRAEKEQQKTRKEEEKRKSAEEKKKEEKGKQKAEGKSVEEKVKEEQEKQKEIVEKTLIKPQ